MFSNMHSIVFIFFNLEIDNYFNDSKYIFLYLILFELIMYSLGLQAVPLPCILIIIIIMLFYRSAVV